MAVKTVFLPVVFIRDRSQPVFNPTLSEEYRAAQIAAVEQAEAELDGLLNEGYQVVSAHTVEVTNRTLVALICHKISLPKAADDAADGS